MIDTNKFRRTAVTLGAVVGLAVGGVAVGTTPAAADAAPSAATAAVAVNRVVLKATPSIDQVSRTATTKVTATVRGGGRTLPDIEVTISVDLGFISDTRDPASTTVQTITGTSDAGGVVTAFVGSTTPGLQSITAAASDKADLTTKTYVADPAALALTPADATIEAGKTRTFTASVRDGADNPVADASVDFAVDGPGTLSSASATTTADGTATVTLTTAKTDTGDGTVTATIASTDLVAVSTYTLGPVVIGAPASIAASSAAIAGQVSTTDTTAVTATVTDDDGDPIAGQDVTFTVDLGFVGATATADPATTTVTAQTGADGVATAYVGSTVKGLQTITVSLGELSSTASKTYYADPATIALAPADATVTAGTKKIFTATVLDAVGNPVPDAGVTFANGDGPGVLNRTTVQTGADGTASVTLTTATDDLGDGSVTASTFIISGPNSATVDYTVTAPVTVQTVAPTLGTIVSAGSTQTVTVKVTNSDGSAPVAGLEVDVLVSGATKDNGTVLTDAAGNATFSFVTQHKGAFTVKAVAGGKSGSVSNVTPIRNVVTTIGLASPAKGTILALARTYPAQAGAVVAFYFVQNGKYVFFHNVATKADGTATITAPGRVSGGTYSMAARVVNNPDTDSVYSATKSIKIR